MFALKTILEFTAIVLLLVGWLNEDKVETASGTVRPQKRKRSLRHLLRFPRSRTARLERA